VLSSTIFFIYKNFVKEIREYLVHTHEVGTFFKAKSSITLHNMP
jgi:hypothetical protein